jgi:hypothetical protein
VIVPNSNSPADGVIVGGVTITKLLFAKAVMPQKQEINSSLVS